VIDAAARDEPPWFHVRSSVHAVRETHVVAIDTTAQIETPEHVRFAYQLAGPTRRALAYLIDLLIRVGLVLVVGILTSLVDVAAGIDGVSIGAMYVFYFALDWFYYVLFETIWSGRSPGKRALGLRVIGQDGHSLTVLDSVLRNLLRAADFLPFGYAVGVVVMGRDSMFRRLGDMVAGTVVVFEPAGRLAERLQLTPAPTEAELEALPMRPDVSREELEAIELLLRRHEALAPARERELAEMLAPQLAARLGTSYRDPVRFLGLVYARAHGHEAEQDRFVAQRRESWRELEQLLGLGKELHRSSPAEIARAASLYRSVSADLMRARAQFGPELVRYLDGLAARAHNLLYGTRAYRLAGLWDLIARDFPRTVRVRWRFLLLASALFYVPLGFGLFGTLASAEFAETIMPAEMLANMESMYEQGFEDGRDVEADSQMAGFYVLNNIGIAFRCFATGILFGLGSLFFSIYNGLVIGVGFGWVIRVGHGVNIGTFVCGHGPFELTAIVISAAAGLQMGWALVATQGRTRLGSLRAQARELGHLIVGAAAMLLIAAVLEGYWSPSSLAPQLKWAASGVFIALIGLWLGFAGSGRSRS
jgi:uncharacterized membrane protein SpoIIM required for sporulation/uncharacterized RDD family membrane protein YckC